jgi:hypothetical protein
VNAAKNELQSLGFTNVNVDGFFWQQGESDANSSTNANAYQGRLQTLINDFRAEIGTADTKVVLGGILASKFSFGSTINTAMQAVDAADPKTAWFSTSDLSIANTADGIHFSFAGQLEMGTRFATKFNQLNAPEPGAMCLLMLSVIGGSVIFAKPQRGDRRIDHRRSVFNG